MVISFRLHGRILYTLKPSLHSEVFIRLILFCKLLNPMQFLRNPHY